MSDSTTPAARLGIYFDAPYQAVSTTAGRRFFTAHPATLFFCEVGCHFDRLVLFGHVTDRLHPGPYAVPDNVEMVELPYFTSLRRPTEVMPALVRSVTRLWRGLDHAETVWIFGPHPVALVAVAVAIARRKCVVLGVRQDLVPVLEASLAGRRWFAGRLVGQGMDRAFRALSRRLPTTITGQELADRYGGPEAALVTESVVSATEIAGAGGARDGARASEVSFLTVGRLAPEKNPLLLIDALARLEAEHPGRHRLVWVGEGPMEGAVRSRAKALGLSERIEFAGYVPVDAGLLDLYRNATAFVHVSLSESVPKVLIEALISATPIVATDVGGVRATLGDGRAALLVPPGDLEALVSAMRLIIDDAALRTQLAAAGIELARELTREAQAARGAAFIKQASVRRRA